MIMRYITLGALGVMLSLAGGVWYFQGKAERNAAEAAEAAAKADQWQQAAEQYQQAVGAYADHFTATVDTYNERMTKLQGEYQDASKVADHLSELLEQHDLSTLAFRKPDLVERRLNDGTQRMLDDLEAVTTGLGARSAEADDGKAAVPGAGKSPAGEVEG